MQIYCGGCEAPVEAVLTNGKSLFPQRPELAKLPFWQCPCCENYVGCHHKTNRPTRPLGSIPTPNQRRLRRVIHDHLDVLHEMGRKSRANVYRDMAQKLGVRSFHTAALKGDQQHHQALQAAVQLSTHQI